MYDKISLSCKKCSFVDIDDKDSTDDEVNVPVLLSISDRSIPLENNKQAPYPRTRFLTQKLRTNGRFQPKLRNNSD